MDKQAFIAAVKAAGIVGEGGAGFPAHVKYAADADTVIANGCECEPLLHTDQHHMLHHANEIVRAFSELMQATGAKRGVIALKKKYKEATKILTDAIGNRPIELALLPNFYPAGDEQTLVREVTGRSVPPLGLPLMVGAVVANVGTLVSVAHALDGKPVTHKFLTVTGEVKKPGIVCVPIGTPLSACLEAAGGPTVSDPVFVLGGHDGPHGGQRRRLRQGGGHQDLRRSHYPAPRALPAPERDYAPQFHASPRRFGLYPVPQLFRAVPPPPPRPSF